MVTNPQNPLSELKPLHLPPEVSIWPLAIGWYIVLAIIVLVIVISWWLYSKRQKIQQTRNEINQLWLTIETDYLANRSPEIIAIINVFLKRVAVKSFADKNPQLLSGNEWLHFLDNSGKTTQFSQGAGKLLANPYCRITLDNPHELFNLIRNYLKVVL